MSYEDLLRTVVREEVRAAVADLRALLTSVAADKAQRLPVIQAAAACGTSPASIYKWMRAGQLTRYGKGRGTTVDVAELDALLKRIGTEHTKRLTDQGVEERAEQLLRRHG